MYTDKDSFKTSKNDKISPIDENLRLWSPKGYDKKIIIIRCRKETIACILVLVVGLETSILTWNLVSILNSFIIL